MLDLELDMGFAVPKLHTVPVCCFGIQIKVQMTIERC